VSVLANLDSPDLLQQFPGFVTVGCSFCYQPAETLQENPVDLALFYRNDSHTGDI